MELDVLQVLGKYELFWGKKREMSYWEEHSKPCWWLSTAQQTGIHDLGRPPPREGEWVGWSEDVFYWWWEERSPTVPHGKLLVVCLPSFSVAFFPNKIQWQQHLLASDWKGQILTTATIGQGLIRSHTHTHRPHTTTHIHNTHNHTHTSHTTTHIHNTPTHPYNHTHTHTQTHTHTYSHPSG